MRAAALLLLAPASLRVPVSAPPALHGPVLAGPSAAALPAPVLAPPLSAGPRPLLDAVPAAANAAAPLPVPHLAAEADTAAWLAEVEAAAQASPTARRVFRAVRALAARRGYPVPVEVGRTKLGGEFDYDTLVVRVSASHRRYPPLEAVPVLAHELLHVLQKERGLPSDAFEMELEAYAQDFRVSLELGLGPGRRAWDRKVDRHFRGELDAFMAWLLKEYADNRGLISLGAEEYAARLERDAESARRRIARSERAIARREAALGRLRAAGHPAEALAHYEAAELGPWRARLREARVALSWAERDLAVFRDPAALRRYRAYARRVMAVLRRVHAEYNGLTSGS